MRRNRFGHRQDFKKKHFSAPKHNAVASIIVANRVTGKPIENVREEVIHSSFRQFALCDQLLRNISSKQYHSPTPIQDQAIDQILAGRDIIGIANTGTGKTGAFLIPLIDKVFRDKSQRVLIVVPTRELALQINSELQDFSRGLNIYSALSVGGMNMNRQRSDLRRNPNFVIGTPGRIKDFIRSGVLILSRFNNVVLDEADRMVDIGFIGDVKYFISLLPQRRQSLFFSATIPPKVKEILSAFVQNPVTISVKIQDTVSNIEQDVIHVVDRGKKVEQLHDLLIQDGFEKVLIFGRTKWSVQKLTDELARRGFRAGAIHGNKRQSQRHRVLEQFKRSEIKILLATDVASRGLDIDNISHVINYDVPSTYDDYIHRIGRTGRANKKGTALTFIDEYLS